MDLDPVELRVLGCLIEKQRTTPRRRCGEFDRGLIGEGDHAATN